MFDECSEEFALVPSVFLLLFFGNAKKVKRILKENGFNY